MLRHGSQGRLCGKVRRFRQALVEGDAVRSRELLSPQRVQRAVEAEGIGFRQCLFTPLVTLWTFLTQVLDPDGSCRNAVAKLLAFLAVAGKDPKSNGAEKGEPRGTSYLMMAHSLLLGLSWTPAVAQRRFQRISLGHASQTTRGRGRRQ